MQHATADYQRIQDPVGLIPEHEPVFLIRGNDLAGPATLLIWATLNEVFQGNGATSEVVRRHAQRMQDWQKDNNIKADDGQPVSEEESKEAHLANRLVKLRVLTVPNDAPSCYRFEEEDFPYNAERITTNKKLADHLKANCMELGFAIEERVTKEEEGSFFFCGLTRTENNGVDAPTTDRSIAENANYNTAAIAACVEALEFGKYRWQSSRETFIKLKSKKPKQKYKKKSTTGPGAY